MFERARNDFEKIEKRAETASVRLVEKEVGLEMKGYLSRFALQPFFFSITYISASLLETSLAY